MITTIDVVNIHTTHGCKYFLCVLVTFSTQYIIVNYIHPARPSSTMLKRNNENRHLCLVPVLRGKVFSPSSLSMRPVVGFQIFIIRLRRFLSIPSLLSVFNKGQQIL